MRQAEPTTATAAAATCRRPTSRTHPAHRPAGAPTINIQSTVRTAPTLVNMFHSSAIGYTVLLGTPYRRLLTGPQRAGRLTLPDVEIIGT